jgi:ribose transport system permease protein
VDAARRFVRTYGARIVMLACAWGAMALWVPAFRGESSFYAALEQVPLLGLVALGLAVTIIAGEFDLSVGSMAAIGGVVTVQLSGMGLWPAVAAATAICAVVGALQGLAIAKLGISSVVFTIGTLIALRGVAYLIAGGQPVSVDHLEITDVLLNRYWIFSVSSVIALAVFAVTGLFLAFHRRGRELYAIGGGRVEAISEGIPLERPLTVAFAMSAGCAALAGALASMRGGTADASSYGALLIFGVTAPLIGGIRLYGGRGTVLNVILGVGLLALLTAGLNARGEDPSTAGIVTGVVLLIVVPLTVAAAKVSRVRRWLARSVDKGRRGGIAGSERL